MIHEKSSSNLDMVIPAATSGHESAEGGHDENNTLDDIFGSSPSDIEGRSRSQAPPVEPSEIPRVRNTHVTNGYRDGISESKARFVQEGFDEGYSLGAELGLRAGWLLGVVESLVKALGQRRLTRRQVPFARTRESRPDELDQDRQLLEQREQLERRRGEMLTEAQKVLAEARKELLVQKLFDQDYFGEDGIWMFDVPGKEEEVTFKEVADAHPVIRKWTKLIRDLAVSWDVDLDAAARAAVPLDDV